jgi:hypothetical protein
MRQPVTLNIDRDVLRRIDEERGLLARSRFVEEIVKAALPGSLRDLFRDDPQAAPEGTS